MQGFPEKPWRSRRFNAPIAGTCTHWRQLLQIVRGNSVWEMPAYGCGREVPYLRAALSGGGPGAGSRGGVLRAAA